MKQFITTLTFALVLAFSANAQETHSGTCGTPPHKSEWLQRYQQNPRVINRNMLETIYVPVTFHLVGKNDGTGYISFNRLMDAFCQLNEIFEQAEIQFYVKGDIRYINNDSYYNHDNAGGSQMMLNHKVANTLNFFICNGLPRNALGYYLPFRDAVALEKGALSDGDFTWAHEAGHYLSLPHTFYGWESTDYDYDSPTPNTVTHANITRQVERVNGSNCAFAGDGFCDTDPDYLNFRWSCNSGGLSPQIQKDPNGVEFQSDGSLIMGYALDNCVSRFTEGQIGAMRANLEEERASYLINQTPAAPLASNELIPVFPIEGQDVQNNETFELQWEAIEGAEFYFVDISRISTFAFSTASYLTTEPFVTVGADDLAADRSYYWRIRPFNGYDACSGPSDVHTFNTADLLSSTSAQETVQALRIYPNPVKENQEAILEFASEQTSNAAVSLLNLTGQALNSRRVDVVPGANRMSVSTAGLPKGLYLVRIDANGGANYRKLLVQ